MIALPLLKGMGSCLGSSTGRLSMIDFVSLVSFTLLKYTGFSIAVLMAADFMGLPVSDQWFDVFVLYVFGRWAWLSIVNGMPEPEEDSSLWYIWCYRSMHSMAHIATAYFSHKRMWKYLSGDAQELEKLRVREVERLAEEERNKRTYHDS